MSIASLAARSFGQNRTLCFVHATTLEEAKYYLKTELGISEEELRHCKLHPIYGSGQGSAASPTIWCLISCRLFEAHSDNAHGASFTSPDGEVTARAHMIGFVGGTYGAASELGPEPQNIEPLLRLAEADAQLWSELLEATGGALELSKLKCHAVSFGFSDSGSSYMKNPAKDEAMALASKEGDKIVIEPLPPTTARKMLGCYVEPQGTNKANLEHVTKLAMKRATAIYSSGLGRKRAWQHCNGIFLPSVAYSFAVSSIKEPKLEKLQSRMARLYLPRLGYNRNTPKAVAHGPAGYGGLGLKGLYLEQGLATLEPIVKHLRASTEAGKLISIALSWNQHVAGTSKPILEDTGTPLPHLGAWAIFFPELRRFLNGIGAKLEVARTGAKALQRANDSLIMDTVISSGGFKDAELKKVNYVRLWLDTHAASDMPSASAARAAEALAGKIS